MKRYIVNVGDTMLGIEAARMQIDPAGLFFYSVDDDIEAAFSLAPSVWRTCCRLGKGEGWPKGLTEITSTESGLMEG